MDKPNHTNAPRTSSEVRESGQAEEKHSLQGGWSWWQSFRARLDAVTAQDVEECKELYRMLEGARKDLGLVKWSSLQGYFGRIPRCVKVVGKKQ